MLAGVAETVFQTTGGDKLVVDCNINPTALAGQVNTSCPPSRIGVNIGPAGLVMIAPTCAASRKNIWGPDIKLEAIYCPLTTATAVASKALFSTGGDGLVVECAG